jgi:hypothetical protein
MTSRRCESVNGVPRQTKAAGVGREHASNRLEERSLAGSVRRDQTEDLACMHLEAHFRECRLIAVALAQRRNLHEYRGADHDGLAWYRRDYTHSTF